MIAASLALPIALFVFASLDLIPRQGRRRLLGRILRQRKPVAGNAA